MPHKLESHPQFNTFNSTNEGEGQRYVLARTAFLEQLVKEPKIQAVFARWDKRTNLTKLAADVAGASDRLAKALGLAHRRQLSPLSVQPLTIDPRDRRIVKLNAVREKAIALFSKHLCAIPKALYQDAVQVARELGIPWPWVSQRLLHAFVLQYGEVAVGLPFTLSQTIEPDKIVLEVNSSTSRGELLAKYRAARPSRLRGRVPKKNTEAPGRYAIWFCRKTVGGVSVRQLAQEYSVVRALMQHGIREAYRLLNLSLYTA
jgi:hypothetical protein